MLVRELGPSSSIPAGTTSICAVESLYLGQLIKARVIFRAIRILVDACSSLTYHQLSWET